MKNLCLISIVLFVLVVGCKQESYNSQPMVNNAAPNISKTETTPESTPDAEITLEKFNRLKTGMTYAEAVKILGKEGEVISESEIGGTKTVMYQWQSSGFGNMNAMFQNGKLISKAQFGLK